MQPDFGHHASSGLGFHVDAWGDGPMVIRFAGKAWRFEHSEMFGPSLLTKENEIAQRQPVREDHPFWLAFSAWCAAGMKSRAIKTKKGRLIFYLCHAPQPL